MSGARMLLVEDDPALAELVTYHFTRAGFDVREVPITFEDRTLGESKLDASFAGQHLTLLNVPSVDDVSAAVREIWWSANSDSALSHSTGAWPSGW